MKYEGFKISKESVDKLFPKTDIDISGYEPPIQIVLGQMRLEQENGIYKAIQEQGIYVDKGELIKALQYDREQYCKGYVQGYIAGLTKDKWISVDERLPVESGKYLVCTKNGNVYQTKFYSHYVNSLGRWGQKDKGRSITHWQHLPEAPKESEEER